MSDLTYWVIVGLFFFVMMRWGCGAHMMGGHGGHGKHDDHKTPNKNEINKGKRHSTLQKRT